MKQRDSAIISLPPSLNMSAKQGIKNDKSARKGVFIFPPVSALAPVNPIRYHTNKHITKKSMDHT
jgi:hypothetical protein